MEVQTNLIHSPNLGTGIRLRYADLLAAGGGDPENATALLLLAAVHGAAGHQFERLQPAVDVLQAARGAAEFSARLFAGLGSRLCMLTQGRAYPYPNRRRHSQWRAARSVPMGPQSAIIGISVYVISLKNIFAFAILRQFP